MRQVLVSLRLFVTAALLLEPMPADASDGPLDVFLLGGQSNMVGHGKVEMGREPGTYVPGQSAVEVVGGLGSLRRMVNENPAQFGDGGRQPLVDAADNWLVRSDVKVYASVDNTIKKGNLTTGFGRANSPWIGPEFGFGHAIGDAMPDDVLLIKMAWGGKSLAVDFRPPSAATKRGGTVGPYYNQLVNDVNTMLANLGTEFPEFVGRSYQLAGFGWHQGWNDRINSSFVAEYEANMADFINDVRSSFGVPEMPFVIATTSMGDSIPAGSSAETLINAQKAMANAVEYPEFTGNVAVVDTRGFWQRAELSPSNFVHHWNHNGITHFQIGEAMGEAMVALIPEPASLALMGISSLLVLRRRRAV